MLPLSVSRNHWCLVIADIDNKIFIYLDPYNSTLQKTDNKRIAFLTFLKLYCNTTEAKISTEGWNSHVVNHIKQNDTYNCGLFIIYFFQQFIKNESLTVHKCMNDFRNTVRTLLLTMSDDMRGRCLSCGIDVTDDMAVDRCQICQRYCHNICAKMENQTCELCRRYKWKTV